MKAATHKRIVFAGFGCATLLAGLVWAAVLFIPQFDTETLDKPNAVLPRAAAAALDSLASTTLAALATLWRDDRYRIAPWERLKKGDGAVTAVTVWRHPAYRFEQVPYGDTFPASSAERRAWLATASWWAIDSLVQAARRPWSLVSAVVADRDSGVTVFARALPPEPVLNTARAVLAAARRDADNGEPARAALRLRAAVTIGRHLQDDAFLAHAVLGARIERDAIQQMATILEVPVGSDPERAWDAARAYLARVDSNLAILRRALRQIRAAGALPSNARHLAHWARDRGYPLAVRHELALAVAFGWAYGGREVRSGIAAERGEALDLMLAAADLPPGIAAVARAGHDALGYDFFRRFSASLQYQTN